MREIYRAIGLMSGTSMDGIDVALIESDGEYHIKRGNGLAVPYTTDFRKRLARGLEDARSISAPGDRPGRLSALEQELTRKHAEAVGTFLKMRHLVKRDINLIGFHGHTVLHRPPKKLTVQLGLGEQLARETGIETVYDFRSRDVEAGGEGAPLVPIYHRALVHNAKLELPVAIINIGGVANVTWLGEGDELLAFDTGPGNALLDDWIATRTGEPIDRDGMIAASGVLVERVLSDLLSNPYCSKEPPKSLDRNDFSLAPLEGLSVENGARTLTAFTALCISRAAFFFPAPPKAWIICGGGAQNPTLMAELKTRLDGKVMRAEDVTSELTGNKDATDNVGAVIHDNGWSSTHMEAEAFAYLAIRAKKGLPITFPTTTGVKDPLPGGVIAPAAGA